MAERKLPSRVRDCTGADVIRLLELLQKVDTLFWPLALDEPPLEMKNGIENGNTPKHLYQASILA